MTSRRRVGVAVLILIAAAVLAALWLRTAHGFSARSKPTFVEAWFAGLARRLALPGGVNQAHNPVPPTAANLAAAGQRFSADCAICHGDNGDGNTPIGRNLYPPPPDLRGSGTQHKSDGALFYSIRNGIRMSGMPAWPQDTDQEIWALVTLIRHLPRQTPPDAPAKQPNK